MYIYLQYQVVYFLYENELRALHKMLATSVDVQLNSYINPLLVHEKF